MKREFTDCFQEFCFYNAAMDSRRVLLISSNRCDQPYPVFPLGLAHLESALRHAGHTTCWVDRQAMNVPLEQAIAEFQPHVIGISIRNVDDVQFQSQETYYDDAIALSHKVRSCSPSPIVLGGTAFSIFPEKLLRLSGADFGVQGPGEVAFVQLIKAITTGDDSSGIPGLVYRRGDQIVVNPCDPEEPIYAFTAERPPELMNYYLQHSAMLNIETQRGCSMPCCYCTYPLIEGRRIRRREPEAIAAELMTLQRQGTKHVFIVDAVFNLQNDHIARVCEAILRRGVEVTWTCFLRPKGLTAELMNLMARAGLTHIEFGADSLCDSVLAEYGKAITFEDILKSSTLARAAGIHYGHFLICGGPGETRETLQTTFANSKRLPGAVIFALAGMRIYPGTPLFARAVREGLLSADADLLRPVYYISPALTKEELLQQLEEFRQQGPNWLIGNPPTSFVPLSDRLRHRGVVGPLWEYYPALQRLT
ncbi:MAG TPA: lipid biosynthesis B12-binding/radical SAM protein [Verrucomicrobiae bacterium]|nr:lipid biosynthesis B12-binding/radical SAM protein [Verrucomicrobiae bacterium]